MEEFNFQLSATEKSKQIYIKYIEEIHYKTELSIGRDLEPRGLEISC